MNSIMKNKLLPALLIALSLVAGCATDPTFDSEAEQFAAAKEAFLKYEYTKAAQLLEPLALQGNDQAQYSLGYLYFYGLGVAQNTALGKRWIGQSAAKGNKKAIEALEMFEKQKKEAPSKEEQP